MATEIIANQNPKENPYLEFEQKFKAWRQENPIPSFDVYIGIYMEESDNLELFYEVFESTFDELIMTVFDGELDDEERQLLNKQMRAKYGDKGTEVDELLDNVFKLKYRPKDWALAVMKHRVLNSDQLKRALKEQLEETNSNEASLHPFIKKKVWDIFLMYFVEGLETQLKFELKFKYGDEDFNTKMDSYIAKFIRQELEKNPITYFKHIRTFESFKGEIEAIQSPLTKTLKGNFLTYSMKVEDKIFQWVKENEIEIDKLRDIEPETLKSYVEEFHCLFNQLIRQWLEVHCLNRGDCDFDDTISQLYNKLKTKYKIDVIAEVIETRMALLDKWQKLNHITEALKKETTGQMQALSC